MTLEEKRDKLHNRCNDIECSECPLTDAHWSHPIRAYGCLDIDNSPEDEIDEALAIINGVKNVEADDVVNHPSHYTDDKIEVIDFIEDKKLGFCLGNAVKYISRAGKKDPTKEVEDLNKARWYIERRIKEITEGIG